MQYTTLGNTGLEVSRLGFGAMRLPMQGETIDRELAIPMIHRAFERGVTYIDTAVGYCNQDSQRVVGEALKGWRDKVVLSTKNHCFEANEKAWWTHLEDSLERLDVETIDIYNTHGINGAGVFCDIVEIRLNQLALEFAGFLMCCNWGFAIFEVYGHRLGQPAADHFNRPAAGNGGGVEDGDRGDPVLRTAPRIGIAVRAADVTLL